MQRIKVVTTFLLLFSLMACKKADTNACKDTSLLTHEIACNTAYEPVCGCDGQTYLNSCVAKFKNGIQSFTDGACGCSEYPSEGIVVNLSLTNCTHLIRLDNGSYLEPKTLPEGYVLKPGTAVEFSYSEIVEDGLNCSNAQPIDVHCIREVSCIPIQEFDDMAPGFKDPVNILESTVVGDCLSITFSFSGGCEEHYFKLSRVTADPALGAPHIVATLILEHEANGDKCEALITQTMSFDLNSLQDMNVSGVSFNVTNKGRTFIRSLNYVY